MNARGEWMPFDYKLILLQISRLLLELDSPRLDSSIYNTSKHIKSVFVSITKQVIIGGT